MFICVGERKRARPRCQFDIVLIVPTVMRARACATVLVCSLVNVFVFLYYKVYILIFFLNNNGFFAIFTPTTIFFSVWVINTKILFITAFLCFLSFFSNNVMLWTFIFASLSCIFFEFFSVFSSCALFAVSNGSYWTFECFRVLRVCMCNVTCILIRISLWHFCSVWIEAFSLLGLMSCFLFTMRSCCFSVIFGVWTFVFDFFKGLKCCLTYFLYVLNRCCFDLFLWFKLNN